MRKLLLLVACWCMAPWAWATSPYLAGNRLPAADVPSLLAQVERKLQAEGFTVVGRHQPRGLPAYGSVVATDPALLDAIRTAGGHAILAAAIRIGVKSDGSVSYTEPEYWGRAYLRERYDAAVPALRAVRERLARALGAGAPFGGDVPAADLPRYRYMFGMERIDDPRTELRSFASFDEALRTVQARLAKGVGHTAKVYEVVLPAQQLAVIGVALNDAESGEAWWAGKIGPEHIAALPYEIFIIGGKAHALYGRYRIALSWPALGMGQFMTIARAPDLIHQTMEQLAAGDAP